MGVSYIGWRFGPAIPGPSSTGILDFVGADGNWGSQWWKSWITLKQLFTQAHTSTHIYWTHSRYSTNVFSLLIPPEVSM